jgi:UDP-MurNAc hydroxylase
MTDQTGVFRVHFICHASVLIEIDGIKILTDPWFFGRAFNEGWSLWEEPQKEHLIEMLKCVDVVWISHEHPDHLNFPTLKFCREYLREDVPIYFQKTNEVKVKKALFSLGFRDVRLVSHLEVIKLTPKLELSIYCDKNLDSALILLFEKERFLLNINDVEMSNGDCKVITKRFGYPEVVLNQFSLAGSDGVEKNLVFDKEQILNSIVENHIELQAKVTIPIASFINFCCVDNCYINKYANKISDVVRAFDDKGLMCVPLIPFGKPLVLGEMRDDNQQFKSLQAEGLDYFCDKPKKVLIHGLSTTTELDAIKSTIMDRLNELNRTNYFFPFMFLQSVVIHIKDLDVVIEIDFFKKQASTTKKEAHIIINSQPLYFAFKQKFGLQTLGVSGRYICNEKFEDLPPAWNYLRIITSLDNSGLGFSISALFKRGNLVWLWERKTGIVTQLLKFIRIFTNVFSSSSGSR